VCHGFRLTKRDDYFWVSFDQPLLNRAVFLAAARAVLKNCSNLKLNHHREIRLAQIHVTPCMIVKILKISEGMLPFNCE